MLGGRSADALIENARLASVIEIQAQQPIRDLRSPPTVARSGSAASCLSPPGKADAGRGGRNRSTVLLKSQKDAKERY